ncbi:FtsW/RodA/SpoVE family cell cycle protein [Gloeothece verrucosa]|uniref:Probable peptidoglycan glycosyltransferase FtsW n=1 Tax=Gloeothece verrucosa (strain PCC 7822) TaxID=497965 RepID=E0UAT6_GLOV7|nr:FtsW/RodA/SpoVE family cell cycle protein [Gloeothece verrucosa]ADN13938.1 cell cycle protein [Gloeothece verrucosa PCC 7822]
MIARGKNSSNLRWIRYLFPFFESNVETWSVEARLLRWLTLLWLSIGLIIQFSASYPVYGPNNVIRQLIWLWIGMIGFNFITRSPLRYFLNIAPWMVLLVLGMILSTLVPGLGETVNGATRWIKIGPILIQPSELMKPFLVLQSARIFGDWFRLSWKIRLQWVGLFGVVLAGILIQPNLSTTALCGITLWLIALASGLPMFYLLSTAIGGGLTGFISISLQEYQRRRVLSFMNPWADPRGDGYQLVQSLLAIGSGGNWGVGYGMSQQKQFYLPFADTDFIFAVYAEEFGFIGGILLLLLLMAFATVALSVALKCRHRVKRLVAMGAMTILVGQSLLNIGVATGSLPTTGLPLPLFSYGGSSSLASLFLAGLLIRVARESSEAEVVPMKNRRATVNE